MRLVSCLVVALFLFSTSAAIAKEKAASAKSANAPAKKSTKAKKPSAATPAAAAPAKDPTDTAVASCKKHIESMLKESAETRFGSGPELRVQPVDGGNFDVSGWVTSKQKSGETKRADFVCHAARYGGDLWTTRTSLSYDR